MATPEVAAIVKRPMCTLTTVGAPTEEWQGVEEEEQAAEKEQGRTLGGSSWKTGRFHLARVGRSGKPKPGTQLWCHIAMFKLTAF